MDIKILIRSAGVADLDGILAVEIASFGNTAWTRGLFMSEFDQGDNSEILVAESMGLILGYIVIKRVMVEENLYEFHIASLAVMPDFRRHGIANFLIDRMKSLIVERGQTVEGITLEVRESNQAAINLYTKNGFISAGIRKSYYENGESAVIMWYRDDECFLGEQKSSEADSCFTNEKQSSFLKIDNGDLLSLSIESSCDETSCAILSGGRNVLSNVIYSQIDLHKKYGGVVPEIASRNHLEKIEDVVAQALEEAGKSLKDIDFISATAGPGLVGALLVGLLYAKSLAYSLDLEFIAVNHIEGHIASNYIDTDLRPPFLCLVISGGHTHLVDVRSYTDFEVIGRTLDDAVGEAYDKIAKAMGLGYPGGPIVDKLAQKGVANIDFPRPMINSKDLDFSFSGLKSAVLNYLNSCKMKGQEVVIENVCASFQKAVVDILRHKTGKALERTGRKILTIAGGVAANSAIRSGLSYSGVDKHMPAFKYCTDNAAMIGSAAYFYYFNGFRSGLDIDACPNVNIGDKKFVKTLYK